MAPMATASSFQAAAPHSAALRTGAFHNLAPRPDLRAPLSPNISASNKPSSGPQTSSGKSINVEELFKSSVSKPVQVQELLSELANTEQLGKRGELWFAAQAVLLLLLAFPPEPLETLVRVGGVSSIIAGAVLVTAGQQSLGNSLSPFPSPRTKDHELITDGAYSYSRHPMYGGLLLIAFGLSAATGSNLRITASAALFFVLDRKVELEEGALEEKYSSYADYKKGVKRLIPYIW